MNGGGLSLELLVFLVAAGAAVVSALFVVLHRNPVVNAVALVANLGCVAVFFLLLHAPFLAAVQVIVYAGAIMVLFLFVIMLLDLRAEMHRLREGMFQRGMAVAGGAAMLLILLTALRSTREAMYLGPDGPADFGSTHEVARRLLTAHLVSFELASVLLLVAMVGALILSRAFLRPPGPRGEPR